MDLLDNPIRNYAWGSRTSIAALQGRPTPTAEPEAELWMGAHPDSPSTVCRHGERVAVGDVVAADPIGLLGSAVVDRFGPRLPFMLKVLAADSSLSLQAHPDAATAARRYAEEQLGSARVRLYTDPHPKPELLVALGEFDALCGFREPAESAAVLDSLGVPALHQVICRLRTGSVAERLRGAVEMLLRWPGADRADVVAEVARAASRNDDLAHVLDLSKQFPDDLGVVVTLLLNHVTLDGDEAIWMPAGNMHAYLGGTGMEVLGASDNVLRGGLTAKPIDVDELLRVVRFEVLAEPVMKPVVLRPGVLTWPVPIEDFAMFRVSVSRTDAPVELAVDGPRIVFCAQGVVTVDDRTGGDTAADDLAATDLAVDDLAAGDIGAGGAAGGSLVRLPSGSAAFGPADRPLSISGHGIAFIATAG